MNKPTIDFDTMRVNCIEIHQQTYELFLVAKHIGEELNLIVQSADELRTHEQTKTWDGMGRFAKKLYDNTAMWAKLPEQLWVVNFNNDKVKWKKENALKELIDCYYQLGGKNLETV